MKAKPFYKNNKHNNNMDSKEKENINEEELKAQAVPEENGEEATEKEEVTLTEEEKLAQERQRPASLRRVRQLPQTHDERKSRTDPERR